MGSKKDGNQSKKGKDKKRHKSSEKKKKSKSEKSSKKASKHDKKIKIKKARNDSSSGSSSDSSESEKPRECPIIGPQIPSSVEIGPHIPSNVDIGPQLPISVEPDIGPQLPPGIKLPSSDGDIGPQLPPESANSGADEPETHSLPPSGEAQPTEANPRPKKAGPALPAGVNLEKLAAMRDKVDWQRLAIEEEEDEEDTVGPAAPGQETLGYLRATAAAEARVYNKMLSEMEAEEQAKVPKHEEWFAPQPVRQAPLRRGEALCSGQLAAQKQGG